MTGKQIQRLTDLMRSQPGPNDVKVVVDGSEEEIEVIDIIWSEKAYGEGRIETEVVIKISV